LHSDIPAKLINIVKLSYGKGYNAPGNNKVKAVHNRKIVLYYAKKSIEYRKLYRFSLIFKTLPNRVVE